MKLADFKVAVQRDPSVQRYEWRIAIQEKTQGQVQLRSGMSVAFDLALLDRDADGTFSWVAWGPSVFKFDSSRLGDVVLVGEAVEKGILQVQVRWEGTGAEAGYVKVRIQPLGPAAEQWQARTDRKGFCAVELPAGAYEIAVGRGNGVEEKTRVEVQEGGAVEVPLVMNSPAGLIVPAGKGKVVKAGSGTQQGAWQTIGAADGLLASISYSSGAMLQDRKGDLWFGTLGKGVCRYDGVQFVYFSKEDGLADDQVIALGEDREGRLWFGTPQGVSRFDGQTFATFTTADGLAGNYVATIAADREGNLWFGTGAGASRYDGRQFTTFTTAESLAGNYVATIAADREGNLWFGTAGGVSRYDGKKWTTFTSAESLADNYVAAIAADREGNLWFGTAGGVSRYDGKKWSTFTVTDGLGSNIAISMAVDGEGNLWVGTHGGGVSRYDGKAWTTFTTADGLASDQIISALTDREGDLWFAAYGGGVSRYSAQHLTTFTTREGLVHNLVKVCLEDLQGNLWFGTTQGVSRYDGKAWTTFTTKEGLADNSLWCGLVDRQGQVWFGTRARGGGVSRYDGKTWTIFTTKEGLADNDVRAIAEDREGNLWFGTYGGGVSRYDGQRFKTFTVEDGLGSNVTDSILPDREGNLWFGTRNGSVSRYDGKTWTTFPIPDGQADSWVWSILQDRENNLWFGTYGGSVFRYDGKELVDFSTQVGLKDNVNLVNASMEDRRGHLWFGTWGGGIRRYDGTVFQHLQKPDGLPSELMQYLMQARNGDIWIASEGGVTRYRPGKFPPAVRLVEVLADRSYGPAAEIELPSTQDYLSFAFEGASLRTRPEQMVYVYRLLGHDDAWRQVNEGRVEYPDLPVGNYVFEVKAVDPDLNYSEPATVRVKVHLPYGQLSLYGLLGLALVGLTIASGTAVRRRRAFLREQDARFQAQEALNQELEKELQTAHELQMDLMPKEAPQIPSLDLAGRCIPANHVGGDFFQYFLQEDTLSITLADVTGHAMEAAIPMVMFSGMLENQMELGGTPQDLFARLNRSLHRTLKSRTFVCCALAELDLSSRALRLASAAFPYPYHFRAATGEVVELQVDAYPLGVRPDTVYRMIAAQLKPGDRLVFCSDGIIEATDGAGAQFGYERTEEVIRSGCAAGLSAAALLERIVAEVHAFTGEAPQGDDQTIVVLRVLNASPPAA